MFVVTHQPNLVLCCRIEVNLVYADKYGYSLEKAMEKEFTGKAKDGLIFTIGMKLKPFPTIANLIKSACAGIGTNEMLLIDSIVRYQVSRSKRVLWPLSNSAKKRPIHPLFPFFLQHVMKDVMAAHIELYSKSIHDRVREECSGKLKDLLLAVLNAAWPEGI